MKQDSSSPINSDEEFEPENSLDADSIIAEINDTEGQVSETYVDVVADYAKLIEPQLSNLGWNNQNAKTPLPPYYKYDMSMQTHTRTGILFIIRLFGEILPEDFLEKRGDPETVLRELVALFTVHDFHKVREVDSDWENEFDIPKYEVEALVDELKLNTFAPTLSIEDYHAVTVSLHKSENSKSEMLTRKVNNYHSILYLADAVASIDKIEKFDKNRFESTFKAGTRNTGIPKTHSIGKESGIVASVLNKAVSKKLESDCYELLTIHEKGALYMEKEDMNPSNCYLHEDNKSTDVSSFLDSIYDSFLIQLRDSFPMTRNRAVLSGTTKIMYQQGKYHMGPLELLLLDKKQFITAIIEKGINQASSPFELPDYATADIKGLEKEIDCDIYTNSYRIEGVARIVHTVYEQIVLPVVNNKSHDEIWRNKPIPALMSAFNVSDETKRQIQKLWNQYAEKNGHRMQLNIPQTETSFPFKYLIAQDVIEQKNTFQGEQPSETVQILTESINNWVNKYFEEDWNEYVKSEIGDVRKELKSHFYSSLLFDSEPLRKTDETPNYVLDFVSEDDKEKCQLCGKKTLAGSQQKLIDVNTELNREVEFEGETVNIEKSSHEGKICYWCQLDVELHSQDTEWPSNSESENTHENKIYVVTRPAYAYMPLSGVLFNRIIDKYNSAKESHILELSNEIFDEDETNQDWMDIHSDNAFGRELISNYDKSFMLGEGYGATHITIPLQKGNYLESIYSGAFTAAVAGMQSGVSVYVSDRPIIRPPKDQERRILHLSEEIDELFNIFGGSRVSMSKLSKTTKALGALEILANNCGHGHAPLHAYTAYKKNPSFSLIGTEMYHKSLEKGTAPEKCALEALILNKESTHEDICMDEIRLFALSIADYSYLLLDEPPNRSTIVEFITDILELVCSYDVLPTENNLKFEIKDKIIKRESISSKRKKELARELAAQIVDNGVNNLGNGRKNQFENLLEKVIPSVVPAVDSLTCEKREAFQSP